MTSRRISLSLIASLVLAAATARAEDPAPTEATVAPLPSETQPEPSSPPVGPAPPPTPGTEPAPGAPTDPSTNEADKRIGVGLDALFLLPIGDFADVSGVIAGPVVRFGYRVIPRLEIALRAGYLFGTTKTQNGVHTNVDILPLWLGAHLLI